MMDAGRKEKNENKVKTFGEPVIVVKDLYKAFNGNEVLCGVNMKLLQGENLVVLGRSGSGKSVLIKCITGLESSDSGIVNVFGKNVPELSYDEINLLRRDMGFLFQGAALYDSMTVRENLEFPLRRNLKEKNEKKIEEMVMEALEDVGLPEAIDKMPSELSGGMRKRVGLARSFILKPKIMFYDEPTTGLDPVTSREISELILKMQTKFGISSLIITHDIPCTHVTSDRIVLLHKGVFGAEGTFDELRNSDKDWVASFFKQWTDEKEHSQQD